MPYPLALLEKGQAPAKSDDVLRRIVQHLVSSYISAWDPLNELIQNAVDAINQRAVREDGAFRGKLLIWVDKASSTVTIEDNGIGITPGSADTMILPGGSFKTTGNTYGHKGLGFTYCAHIAEYIEIETEEHGTQRRDHWKFSGGYEWLTDPTKSPSLDYNLSGSIRSLAGSGTTVSLCFAIGQYEPNIANTSVLDGFFEWASDVKLLAFILRTRTAIGQVGPLFGQPPSVDVDVEVNFMSSGAKLSVPYSFFDFQTLAPFNQQNFPQASEYATEIYLNPRRPNKAQFGIFQVFSHDASNPGQPLKVGKTRGGVSFSTYVYACGKENLAAALELYDPRLGDEFKHLTFTTDVHLAIDGMPCGVPIDSWNNFGAHEQRYFAMVNTELAFGTVLDAGRKTITRHYVDLIVNKIVEMTKDAAYFAGRTSFYELSTQLHTRVAPPTRTPLDYIRRWSAYPLLASSGLLLNKEPDDELGAYVLFGELVGRGHIPGYIIQYISGGAIYDAAFEFELNLKNGNHLNPSANGNTKYGVGQALVQQQQRTSGFPTYKWSNPATGQIHLVTEFKVAAEELLRDIQKRRSEKQIQDINLLICIRFNEKEIRDLQGAVIPVSDAARKLSGVTHELSYAGHTVQMICLGNVIAELEKEELLHRYNFSIKATK